MKLLQIALLVGVAIVVVGLVMMKRNKAKAAKLRNTKATLQAPAPASPHMEKKIATQIGSVHTPSGRRSARLARKSL